MASAPGGFAEYVVTDAGRVHRIPGNNMSYEQAACLLRGIDIVIEFAIRLHIGCSQANSTFSDAASSCRSVFAGNRWP
jgi:NADPH:quinone reductase-like Zn-dependent oxidoreductase